MTQKDTILEALIHAREVLQCALEERKRELGNLLYGCKVSRVDDIEETKLCLHGLELERQIDQLRETIEDLDSSARYIYPFKEV